jgi:hypothetical protein
MLEYSSSLVADILFINAMHKLYKGYETKGNNETGEARSNAQTPDLTRA